MKTALKQRIAFALVMGVITTGIISFTLILNKVGYTPQFWKIWLQSWILAYSVVIPAILFLGPIIQLWTQRLIK